jgi:hypothetical protein
MSNTDLFGFKPFRDFFDRCFPKRPGMTRPQLSNLKHKEDMAWAGWNACERHFKFEAQWYPVTDMLPSDGETVLAAWDRGNDPVTMRTARHHENGGWLLSGGIKPKTKPTHWRKLPSLR